MSPKSPVKDVQETLFQGGPCEGEVGAAPKKEMIVSVSGAGDTRTSVRPMDITTGNGNGSNTNMCRVNSEAETKGGRIHDACYVQMFTFSVNILGIVRDVISEKRAIHVFSKNVEEECIRVSGSY